VTEGRNDVEMLELDPNEIVNAHLASVLYEVSVSDASSVTSDDSRTELDSHANMDVVGSNCIVVHNTGKSAQVSPFTSDLGALQNVPIDDAAVAYDCPVSGETTVFIVSNALNVLGMDNNLLLQFLMVAMGLLALNTVYTYCFSTQVTILPLARGWSTLQSLL